MKTGSLNLVTTVGGKCRIFSSKSTKNTFCENCNNTQAFQKYEKRLNEKLVKRLQENHGKTIENLDETKSREAMKEVCQRCIILSHLLMENYSGKK